MLTVKFTIIWKKSNSAQTTADVLQNLGSKETNQNEGMFSERSAYTHDGCRVFKFVLKVLFAFGNAIGPLTKKVAIFCSQKTSWLVNFLKVPRFKYPHCNCIGIFTVILLTAHQNNALVSVILRHPATGHVARPRSWHLYTAVHLLKRCTNGNKNQFFTSIDFKLNLSLPPFPSLSHSRKNDDDDDDDDDDDTRQFLKHHWSHTPC